MLGFSWMLPLSLAHSSHCWGVSLPDCLGCHCLWTRTDKIGWQPTPVSSCITEGKKGTYLPKPTNPSSAGLCHVAWWTSAERWNSWSLQRPQSGLPLPLSPSLPSFFPFLLMSRELFCQIVRNLQQTGSASPAYVHVCVPVCAHLCMMDGGGGENVGTLQIP